jgi:signal transduction histidine kinase
MRQFILYFTILVFSEFLFGQSKKEIDSINKLDFTYISNNLKKCEKLFKKSLAYSENIKDKQGEAESLNNLSSVYSLLGIFDKAVALNLKSVEKFEELKNYKKIAAIYGDLAYRIRYVDEKQGLEFFRKGISIGETHNLYDQLSALYNNYGEMLKEKDIDSALYYYQKSLGIAKKYKIKISIPFSLNKIAEAYALKKDFKKAFSYLDESDNLVLNGESKFLIGDNIAYRGDVFYEIPNVDSAIYYYERSIVIAKDIAYNGLERFCTKRLAELYQKKNNFEKALFYFKEFKKLEDNSLNKDVKNKLVSLQVVYETEKTKRELAEEKVKNAEKETKLENGRKRFLVILGISILLMLSIFFVYYFQKVKRKNLLIEKELQVELESSRKEKEFFEEKLRIGRELHDNIGSHLTFMISSLDNISFVKEKDTQLDKIANLSNFGRLTMKDLRDTIWAMNHDGGTSEQLLARISELRAVLPSNLLVSIHSDLKVNKTLNGLQMLNFYRIVQEFIQNTIKYAEASEISINFLEASNHILLELKDNGKGFDLNAINFGNGILNMKKRCADMKGVFEIRSGSSGSRVLCKIPI